MVTSMRLLRLRRRRYAISARRRSMLPGARMIPIVVKLPSGRRLERRVCLFWPFRIPLWVVLGTGGWLVLGWLGVVAGLAVAIMLEAAVSYRGPSRGGPATGSRPASPPPDGGPSGVREPRCPQPTGDIEAASLSADPASGQE